jgi:YHS domain-containing protein
MKGKSMLLVVILFFAAALATPATYGFGMRSGQKEMEGMGEMTGGRMCGCCAVGMVQPENPRIPLTQGRKEVGEEFICPVDGMRMRVTEDTPSTEYRGKTYYFCTEEEKRAFLQNPDRYMAREQVKEE